MSKSTAGIRREKKRLSPDTASFRERIEMLLACADPDIACRMRNDLKAMTYMPYYKIKTGKASKRLTKIDVVKGYATLLIKAKDMEFAKKLLSHLHRNQNQTIRRLAPKIGAANEVWEHAIPSGYFAGEILKMIESGSLVEIDTLVGVYMKAGQRGLSKRQEALLINLKDRMPDGWDWRKPNVDYLARYAAVGLVVKD